METCDECVYMLNTKMWRGCTIT